MCWMKQQHKVHNATPPEEYTLYAVIMQKSTTVLINEHQLVMDGGHIVPY